ncbi:hypothetical protein NDK47_07210 [Brevibacillus ruminantium]|uniref:Uncharacterized protein n=1 Tax=Brevibacillus ruminantium TaxID=2950604 RepID=A0ABY4WIU6_9BACL|nr:hypothetical protein [Brevibacillus ruminantium]USG67071.1 hypothetical protein NDK47_07210 [Brevibacillus ruminantium]
MEKPILKTALYSFLIGFALCIIFLPIGVDHIPWFFDLDTRLGYTDYFYLIARYALMFSMACTLAVTLLLFHQKRSHSNPLVKFVVEWIIEPLYSLFIGFASVTLIGFVISFLFSAFLLVRNWLL